MRSGAQSLAFRGAASGRWGHFLRGQGSTYPLAKARQAETAIWGKAFRPGAIGVVALAVSPFPAKVSYFSTS